MCFLQIVSRFLAILLCVSVAGPAGGEATSRAASQVELSRGKARFWHGDPSGAAAYFEAAVRHHPESCTARFWHGVALLIEADASEARRSFEVCGERGRVFRAYAELARRLAHGELDREVVVGTLEGLRLYYVGDYDEARRALEAAIAANGQYGEARLWLALTLLRGAEESERAGASEQALAGSRRALEELEAALAAEIEPLADTRHLAKELEAWKSDGDAGLGAGLTYFQEAQRGAEAPREGLDTPADRVAGMFVSPFQAGSGYLDLLDEPVWEWRLGARATSDSNPRLLPDDPAAGEPPASDASSEVDLRGEYHPFYDRGAWSLGLAFEGGQTLYQDFDFLDSTRLRGSVALARGSDPLGFLAGPLGYTRVPFGDGSTALLLQVAATYRWLDGESFDRLLQVGAGWTWRPCGATATQLDLELSDREVFGDGAGGLEQSGREWRVALGQYVYLKRRDRYLRLAAGIGERDAGAAFDAERLEASVELAWPVARRWHLHLAASWLETDFDALESNPLFPSFLADTPREDTSLDLAATLVWRWTDSLRLVARTRTNEQEIDVGSASAVLDPGFGRQVFSLGVTWFLERRAR